MTPDIAPLAQAAVELLKQYWAPAAVGMLATGTLREAGRSLFVWLKEKFTKPAAAGALQEAEASPDNATKLEALALQIRSVLEDDPAFREELLARVPPALLQNMSVNQEGSGNISVQTSGAGHHITIQTDRRND
jgi:hypothetical protein